MKFLPFFMLFICATLSAQTIDCQLIAEISKNQFNQNKTSRFTTIKKSSYGDSKTVFEIDLEKRRRSITTRPSFGNRQASDVGGSSQSETIFIEGISYSKNMIDNTWTYRKNTSILDSMNMKSKVAKFKSQSNECQKTGSETIEGKNYDIIERTATSQKGSETPKTHKSRLWVNFTDKTIKKIEATADIPNSTLTTTIEYDVEVAPIVKPLNAVEYNWYGPKPLLTTNKQGSLSSKKFPEYKDGANALFKFIADNLLYPKAAKDAKVEGTVYVRFMVDTEGQVSDINVARGLRDDMNKAAIEVIKKTSGNWRSAWEVNKPITHTYTMPVKFKL